MQNNFKIRCSAIADIMAKATAGRLIPTGAQTIVETWLKKELYGKEKPQVKSKYLTKGIEGEQPAIELLIEHLDTMFFKNQKRFENDFLTGTPDIIADCIIDVKCSWDCFTFPLFEDELPDKRYWWQMQGYMHLTGVHCAKVAYCLVDAPYEEIEREAQKRSYDSEQDIFDIEAQVAEEMQYSHMPNNLRVKIFDVAYDPDAIEQIKKRVADCNQYADSLRAKLT